MTYKDLECLFEDTTLQSLIIGYPSPNPFQENYFGFEEEESPLNLSF